MSCDSAIRGPKTRCFRKKSSYHWLEKFEFRFLISIWWVSFVGLDNFVNLLKPLVLVKRQWIFISLYYRIEYFAYTLRCISRDTWIFAFLWYIVFPEYFEKIFCSMFKCDRLHCAISCVIAVMLMRWTLRELDSFISDNYLCVTVELLKYSCIHTHRIPLFTSYFRNVQKVWCLVSTKWIYQRLCLVDNFLPTSVDNYKHYYANAM